jgi:transposase
MARELCHAEEKKYSAEFKREAVALVQSSDIPASQIARDLGTYGKMLNRWCREVVRPGGKTLQGPGKSRDEDMAALKREPARVKMERDFLREAATLLRKG